MSTKPRNLLIVCSDEHRRDAMGCMGHPIVRTPHLDALAARGALFTNAYTPSPMCVPARAAIACGEHVHTTGHWDSATPYDGQRRSWMHDLRDAGVHTASIGKLHFRSGEDDNGFVEEILPMHVAGGVGWTIGLLRGNPPDYDATREFADDVGAGESSYTGYDRDITAAATRWLCADARKDTPWAAFVSLVSPHYPLRAPDEFHAMYDPARIDPPIAYAADERPVHAEVERVASFFDYDRHFDAERLREAKVAYYALTTFMDDCAGQVLAALDRSGQAEDTLVIYMSDHGDMLGDHGLWTKQVMYEASAGVPLIIAGPGIRADRTVSTGATLLDVAATAREMFGVDGPAGAPGLPLTRLANAPDDPGRTIFSEYHDGGSTTATFMVRWADWKYVHYAGEQPQLFDLAADPDELTDLVRSGADDERVRDALSEGERRLRAICDPDAVNARCFADQRRRIAELGGEEACRTAYSFSYTPVAGEGDG